VTGPVRTSLRDIYPEFFSFLDRGECGLGYSPKVREFYVKVRSGSPVIQLLNFCPFSGKAFPASLRDRFFDELEELGLTEGLADFENAPAEFQSEDWWMSRHL
jgi:hypothetical protein